ncbi:MAG: FG-GAP-like repeat-containing protein [bacterium]
MKYTAILLLIPTLICAQEFEFQLEPEAFPVEIDGWQPFSPWSGGMTEANPAIADIDADGDLDVLLGEYFGWIRFFRNDGTAYNPEFHIITANFDSIYADESRANPCFRDLDADGDLDLVMGDASEHVFFYRNVGTAQVPDYVCETSNLVPYPPSVWGPELVDIDADGDYDLFCGFDNITFWRNDGTPQEFQFTLVTANFEGITVDGGSTPDFVDIDADGDYDLIIGERYSSHIYFYRNDGDSVNYNFTYVSNHFGNISVGTHSSPEFADLDGDGDYDLLVGSENLGPYYYQNVGTPQQAQFRLITGSYLTLDLGISTPRVQIVDINGDQTLDLLAGSGSTIWYLENSGSPTQAEYTLINAAFQGINLNGIKPFFVDIDHDGDYDILAGEAEIPGPPEIALYINNGTPQEPQIGLYNENYITNPDFFANTCPALADIDADGDYDLFIMDDDGHFFYYQNNGSAYWPNFALYSTQWQGIEFYYPYEGWRTPFFLDLDGDGDLDLLMHNNPWDNLFLYRNIGSPQAAYMVLETENYLSQPYCYFRPFYFADIDLDLDLDLFLGEIDGGIYFLRNVTGETPFVPPAHQTTPYHGPVFTLGPNPANPVVQVRFALPAPQQVTLAIYNLLGQQVATLVNGIQDAGFRTYTWDVSLHASGVYIIRLQTPSSASTQKFTVVK